MSDRLVVLTRRFTPSLVVAIVGLLLIISRFNPALSTELFRENFESGLERWNIGCPTQILPDAEQPQNHFLRIGEGGMWVKSLTLPEEFTLTARVRQHAAGEVPILLHWQSDSTCVQVHFNSDGNIWVARLGGNPWWQPAGGAPIPFPVKVGEWISLRVVCARGCIGIWANDKPTLITRDPLPKDGGLGIRIGSSLSDYDDLVVTTPTKEDLELRGLREKADANLVPIEERFSAKVGGKAVEIKHSSLTYPLKPSPVTVSGTTSPLEVSILPPHQTRPLPVRRLARKDGGTLDLSGPQGEYTLVWRANGKEIGRTKTKLVAQTDFETNDPADNTFFQTLKRFVAGDAMTHGMGGRGLAVNPCWIRDHVHEMKAFKWWKTDITSFIDCLIDFQSPRGFFHEISIGQGDPHYSFVTPEFKIAIDGNSLIRLEIEADVEYLMVEGVYQVWQATGDNAAMAKRLPALERGLDYDFYDPTRWDKKHGLLKRPFSIDTWDFVWGQGTDIRYIKPEMPMGIMHGDNSGLYQACLQVAIMREALGDKDKARQWRKRAEGIRSRANALLWNGTFYIHQYLLTPVNTGADETKMLSLSNPYDINRGMPTHEMAVKIIDEYRTRRNGNPQDYAEWYSIDPPYPNFVGYEAGRYCNGGISGFVGGELAKAALRHGREDYGADILKRLRKTAETRGLVPFFMRRSDGADQGGGPNGWPAAAVMSALMDGLAGLTDKSVLFKDMEVAPRYPAAGITKARVCLCYGVSGAYVTSGYYHDVKAKKIMMQIAGAPRKVHFHVLLPMGTVPSGVRVDGKACKPTTKWVEGSSYCDFDVSRSEFAVTSVAVDYKTWHASK